MGLSRDLISQFVKTTNDKDETTKKETIVYGTVKKIESDDATYVQLDGSEIVTPISSTVNTKEGDRVVVMIKNHAATVTGNLTDPAVSSGEVKDQTDQILKLGTLIADKVDADVFYAEVGRVENLFVDYATIESLNTTNITVNNLAGELGTFKSLTTDGFSAVNATIENLGSVYANIDFANIGEAAIRNLYSKTGFIKDITVKDGVFTGELTGVTISGDLIKVNTLVADALVIQGKDGLYYRLNAGVDGVTESQLATDDYQTKLHGSNIIAKTITADKISVSDLKAFGATIGGFKITDNSLYSGVKDSVGNTTRGIYLDDDGQVAFGDSTQYIKYYEDSYGDYAFEINTDAISFGDNYLHLAKNSRNATIDMCNGLATMYHASKYSYDSLFVIDTAVVEIKGASTPLCLTAGNTSLDNVSIQFANKDGVLGGVGIVGNWLRRYGSNMFDTYTILDSGNYYDVMDSGWYYTGGYGDNFTQYNNELHSKVRYRKIGKTVEVRGVMKPTKILAGSTTQYEMFTLPEGYRPDCLIYQRCQGSNSNTWLLILKPDGAVTFSRYGTGSEYAEVDTGTWLPFQITFLTS